MLDIKNLSITFRDGGEKEQVLDSVSFTMKQGDKVGIVGESGSGKTMMAWAIAGLYKRKEMEKEGQVLFQGTDMIRCSPKELRQIQGSDMGIVFQEPMHSLNPLIKIGSQIEETLLLHTALTAQERYERAIEMMEAVELRNPEQIYESYPHELSGGMRQRVMIAAAMIHEPKLLIADEPTTALDVTVQEQILKVLDKMNREYQTSLLFISHDLSVVRRLCNYVLVMKDGVVVEEGKVEQLFSTPNHPYTKELIAAIPKCQRVPRTLSGEKILTVENLAIAYEKNKGTTCKEISFTVDKGEILGVLGESGSGKTTLARALVGILPIESGRMVCTSNTMQMIFQDPAMSLNPAKPVGWILEEPLKIKGGYSKKERYHKVVAMLRRVGLREQVYTAYIDGLSGGQRQRVAIGLALMLEPDFLIADEPISALDVTIQAQIVQLLLSLQKELQLTIILIAHDLRIVYQMCDNVVVMRNGVIVEQGSILEVFHHPKTSYVKQLLVAQFDERNNV